MPESICPCCANIAKPHSPHLGGTQCPRCGHRWRVRRGHQGNQYYATLVARNDLHTPWFKRKIAERTAALSALLSPNVKRVLEVGCAEGELGKAIKSVTAIAYDGIELSRDAEVAQQVLDRVFRTAAAEIAPPPYDLIVSFHVLEHIEEPGTELNAWSRLLAEDGRLVIEVPNQAGHPLLDTDQNLEHLHQFTPASLILLLSAKGFTCESLTTGHYESPVYPDSIRVVATRTSPAEQRRKRLIARFHETIGGPFVVYGIGGDFNSYVAPLLDDLAVTALFDSSSEKWGTHIGNHIVNAFDNQQHNELPILVSSIKFGLNIREHLLAQGVSPTRLVGLEEIYEPA